MYILILLLAAALFFIAKATAAYVLNRERTRLRFLWFLLPLLGAGFSVYAFMHPKWMNDGREESIDRQFTIGPYPTLDKLKELKNGSYTTVVSLLHPAVVPFEPRLMAEEKVNAAKVGLTVVNIPMLPWISNNTAALDSLRNVIRNTKGKVYLHCYLGKDRVNVARRMIGQEAHRALFENSSFQFRSLDTVKKLERGPVYHLAKDVFFTPFPTKEEYLGYVLAANFQQVVSLVDFREPGAKALMEEEKKTLVQMKIAFRVYDVSDKTTAAQMQAIVEELKTLPKPQLIHPFFSDSKEAKLFLQLYN